MSEPQIAELVDTIVRHQRHFDAMSNADRQWVINNPAAAIVAFVKVVRERVASKKELQTKPSAPKKLLHLVRTVPIPGRKRFVAKKYFKVDTGRNAKVKIVLHWGDFSRYFLPKTEKGVAQGEIKVHKLLRSSLDAPIMAELGDPQCYSTTLADMWNMLTKQPNGEKGVLLVNGYANIFYIHDADDTLWAVSADWSGNGGWSVGAASVENPFRWRGGGQVLSR